MSLKTVRRGVFLDRDGVLCENLPTYVKSWGEFRWLPGALEGLRILAGLRVPLVIVTNQSAVSRGVLSAAVLADIHTRMRAEIEGNGGRIDGVYVCPHRPDEACDCRKPGRHLFSTAAAEWDLDLSSSYLVGDSRVDLEAGWNLNMRVILVGTGQGRETEADLGPRSDAIIVSDLLEAAIWIRRAELGDLRRPAEAEVQALGNGLGGRPQIIRSVG